MRSRPPDETLLIRLTPQGRGAIAVLLVAGPAATLAVGERFSSASGKSLSEIPIDRIAYGRWNDGGEEVIICRRGEDRVEIHSHGGLAAQQRIVEGLRALGCGEISWQAWNVRTTASLIAAEAAEDLALATTERTASILLDQLSGALDRDIRAIAADLDEGQTGAAASKLVELIARSDVGSHLVHPWRVVLAGPPNVGKSSLLNALVGYHRAIVFDQPGTTRDAVGVLTALGGWPVELIDTAGLRTPESGVEASGIARAKQMLSEADAVIFVNDLSRPSATRDLVAVPESDAPTIVVWNKCDLARDRAVCEPPPLTLRTSALTGEGIEALPLAIVGRLIPSPVPSGAGVPFRRRHHAALRRAADVLATGKIDLSRRLLLALME